MPSAPSLGLIYDALRKIIRSFLFFPVKTLKSQIKDRVSKNKSEKSIPSRPDKLAVKLLLELSEIIKYKPAKYLELAKYSRFVCGLRLQTKLQEAYQHSPDHSESKKLSLILSSVEMFSIQLQNFNYKFHNISSLDLFVIVL